MARQSSTRSPGIRRRPFTRQRLHTILTNVIFIGYIRKKGQKPVKSTQFIAQVDIADWDKTQSILSRRNTRREITGTGYKSPLARIMRCQFCGMKIVTDPKPSKNQNYLRCSHGQIFKDPEYYQKKFGQKYCITGYHNERKVMEALYEEVSKLWLNEDVLVWLEEELKELKVQDKTRSRREGLN